MVSPTTGKAANGGQFHEQHQQKVGPSRMEATPTREIYNMNQLTQV